MEIYKKTNPAHTEKSLFHFTTEFQKYRMDSRQKVRLKQVFRAVIQAFYLANPRKPSSIEKEDDD